ncbi:hypothetical protein D1872_247440 [compost metagenome]
MDGQNDMLTVGQMIVYILYLTSEYMRHSCLDGSWNVDNRLMICSRLPYIQYSVTDVQRKFDLTTREALWAVLEGETSWCACGQLLDQLRAFYGDSLNLLLGFAEHLLTLS